MKPKNKKIKLKRIKESITEIEYKKLLNAVKGDETLRENTKHLISWIFGTSGTEIRSLELANIKGLRSILIKFLKKYRFLMLMLLSM